MSASANQVLRLISERESDGRQKREKQGPSSHAEASVGAAVAAAVKEP